MTLEPSPRWNGRRVKFGVRAAVTAVLLALAFSFVNLDTVGEILTDVDWQWLGVGLALIAVIIVFESLQFAEVARAFGHHLSALQNLRMTLVGRFFALLTPAMLGTDVYRAMAMYTLGTGGRASVSLAAISRVMSLMALVPVLLAGLPFVAYHTWPMARFWLFAAVVTAALAVCLLLVLPASEKILARFRWRFLRELAVEASQLRFALLKAPGKWRLWSFAILQHVIRVFAIMSVAKAFGVTVGWTVFFAFVPVSLLIAMIPISVGSWGLRELALVYSLGTVGVMPGTALLTSVAFGLLGTLFGLTGGLIWMTGLGAASRNRTIDDA